MKSSPFIAAAALTSVMTASAFAADLPSRTAPPAPPAAPAVMPVLYNWGGCYVGVNGGGLWAQKKWTDANGENGPRASVTATGWLAGGQAGCNYQVDRWVFGAQIDEDWADATGTTPDLRYTDQTDRAQVTSLGSATLRGGYAWDRFLAYLKGGLAWESDKYSEYATFGSPFLYTGSQNRTGVTVGGGFEYAFTNNLTGFVEYDYYDFGTRGVTLLDCAGSCYGDKLHVRETKDVVKIGLNWKFDFGAPAPAPVVAKY